jgi:MipA family protein
LRFIPLAFVAATSLGLAAPALAQTATTSPPDGNAAADKAADFDLSGDSVTIGVGVATLPDYEGSAHNRLSPAPGAIGSVKGINFQLAGNRFSADLIPSASGSIDIQAGPVAVVNFNRSSVKNIDDVRVRALGKLGTAIELGGYVGIGKTGIITSPYDRLSVSLSYRHDVNGLHDGAIWQPTINYLTPLSTRAAVGLFASAEHADDNYADTYFTVTPAQSIASTLPAYRARGGWKNYTLGMIGTYSLTGNLLHGLKVVGGGTYSRLLNDFGDSPVVSIAGSRSQWLGVVGLAYTF